jgi:membrane protein DedA with SNARE-associated domain/membrane-associated phospholipid phosphatase
VLNVLTHIVSRFENWVYLIVFAAATLESAALLGLLVPGESLVLIGGFLASRGILDLGDLIAVVAAGAVLGDSIGYELGRRFGRTWLIRHGRWLGIGEGRLRGVDVFFARHGRKTVFLARFVGFLRALVPFVAGSSRMRYRSFMPYNVLGGVTWSALTVFLGYFLGASWRIAEDWIGRAAAVVGIVLVFVVALALLWGTLARREDEVRQWWADVTGHPWVAAVRRRFAPQLAFLRARLSPNAYLGLHLTVGVTILVGAAWLFGVIAEDVIHLDPLTRLDQRVARWFEAHTTPHLTTAMLSISHFGSPPVVLGIAAAIALLLLRRRHMYGLLALVLAVPGGLLLNALLKLVFERPRPELESIVTPSGYSFPSGHTMAAAVLYGVLAAFAGRSLRTWRWRVLAVFLAAFLISLVGLSRIYLGAHYLSDVLGAGAEGLAWLALCLTAVDTLRRRRQARRGLSPPADHAI